MHTSRTSSRFESSLISTQGLRSSMYWFARSAIAITSRMALPNSRDSYSAAMRPVAFAASWYRSGSARRADSRPSKCLLMKLEHRDAILTTLPTRSEFTRREKSSKFRSIVDSVRELACEVVAQVLRVEMVQVRAGLDEGAGPLRHLLAVDGQEAVDEHAGRHAGSRLRAAWPARTGCESRRCPCPRSGTARPRTPDARNLRSRGRRGECTGA